MTNPYEPSLAVVVVTVASSLHSKTRRRLAGAWLAAAGVVCLVVVNLVGSASGAAITNWSPVWLIGLGVLVALEFRIAETIARLFGSFFILGLVILPIALVADGNGTDAGGSPGPSLGEIGLSVAVASAIILVPWWLLQTALRGEPRVGG